MALRNDEKGISLFRGPEKYCNDNDICDSRDKKNKELSYNQCDGPFCILENTNKTKVNEQEAFHCVGDCLESDPKFEIMRKSKII